MSLDAIRARLARDGAYYIDASILEDLDKGRACDYGQRTAAKMLRERGDWIVHAESEIARLTTERDEARREVCAWEGDCADGEREYARQRGWDCFKESSDDR